MSKATTAAAPGDPLIGQSLGGKYEVQRLIGRGGVGLVYLAGQNDPERDVVIKVLSPEWVSDDEAVARFDREATRLGGLRHPNIVSMLDHGREDGRAYLVMEYLEGELLSDYVGERTQLSVDEFVPIAAQVLKGIGHAHSRELMVRDVKPANIMLCERKGRANFVKILDFGLAKLLKDDKPVTEEHVLGTVGYLAPEAIRGESVDLRVDVYAIGVLFYHMLCGELPFDGSDSAAVFYKTINEPAPPLRDRLPTGHDVPDGLIDLVHACLEKDPDERPADANAIVERLIDTVPASMFRLPRSDVETGSPLAPAGAGNTGMVELVGRAAVSGNHRAVESTQLRIVTSSLPEVENTPSESMPAVTTAVIPPRPALGLVAIALIAGALMALVGGGIALLALGDDDEAPPAAAAVGSDGAAEGPDERVHAGLATADRLIGEGKLDEAANALDGVRGLVGDAPELRGRLERSDRALLVAQLMNTAARFEGDNDIASAVSTYRDVLAADPTHAVARARLSRLTARADGDSAASGVDYGAVKIKSRPTAILFIDGEPMGPTPFKGKLPVGTHKLRMTARGHQAWEGSIEIAPQDNDPVQVRLHGKGWSKAKTSADREEPAAAPPTPEPAPVVEPAAAAPKPKPEKKRRGVFLPTKKSDDNGGVFLPTKE